MGHIGDLITINPKPYSIYLRGTIYREYIGFEVLGYFRAQGLKCLGFRD